MSMGNPLSTDPQPENPSSAGNPFSDNPYATPAMTSDVSAAGPYPAVPAAAGRGMTRHVPVVAILMMVQGGLELLAGLGLMGMRERIELFGGSVTFDAEPGEGTRVLISVPVPATIASRHAEDPSPDR